MTRLVLTVVVVFLIGPEASTQGVTTFKARLGVVPVDAATQPTITGSGSLTAVLNGSRVSVTGTFAGLQSPATLARVHFAPRGIRGAAAHDLVVSKATAGTIQGELLLTPAQVDHLRRGRLYVQLHSEKAPEGNLWGWLLP